MFAFGLFSNGENLLEDETYVQVSFSQKVFDSTLNGNFLCQLILQLHY